MYKNLTPEEERMIRRGTDATQPPIGRGKLLRNVLLFALIFLCFVLIAFAIVSSGASIGGR